MKPETKKGIKVGFSLGCGTLLVLIVGALTCTAPTMEVDDKTPGPQPKTISRPAPSPNPTPAAKPKAKAAPSAYDPIHDELVEKEKAAEMLYKINPKMNEALPLSSLPPAADPATVYITASGCCYHRKSCRTLKRSKKVIPISVENAKNKDRRACKVCKP